MDRRTGKCDSIPDRSNKCFFLLPTTSRPDVEPFELRIQWASHALWLGIKRMGRKAGWSRECCVKNEWSYNFTSLYAFMTYRGVN
jgi:hypothetical protein